MSRSAVHGDRGGLGRKQAVLCPPGGAGRRPAPQSLGSAGSRVRGAGRHRSAQPRLCCKRAEAGTSFQPFIWWQPFAVWDYPLQAGLTSSSVECTAVPAPPAACREHCWITPLAHCPLEARTRGCVCPGQRWAHTLLTLPCRPDCVSASRLSLRDLPNPVFSL